MSIATQKKIGWFAALLVFSGWLNFSLFLDNLKLALLEELYLWPLLLFWTTPLTVLVLLRCYRLEPIAPRWRWHFSFIDVCLAAFFTIICVVIGLLTDRPRHDVFSEHTLPLSFGVGFLLALNISEWRGYEKYSAKIPMALGFTLLIYGFTCWTGFGVCRFFEAVYDNRIYLYRHEASFFDLMTVPIGWAFCADTAERSGREAPVDLFSERMKMAGWFLLSLSFGGLLFLSVLWFDHGFPVLRTIERDAWSLSLLVAFLILSVIILMRCYRTAPFKPQGKWHLSILDFYIVTIYSGLWISIWLRTGRGTFLYWGAASSALAALWMVAGLLAAEVRGFSQYKSKFPYAFGFMLKSFGFLVWTSLIGICILIAWIFGLSELMREIGHVLTQDIWDSFNGSDLFFYLTLPALPIGWAICAEVVIRSRRRIETAP